MKPDHTNRVCGQKTKIENELLLCLLRLSTNDESSDRISSLLKRQLNWEYLLRTAHEHRVVPTIHRRLRAFATEMPQPVLAEIRTRFLEISSANLDLTRKLMRLLALLRENDIPTIAYKGPALAQSAYGDIRLRHFTDLDIMVRKTDVLRVKELFIANGCSPGWSLTKSQEAAVLRHHYEYPLLCNKRRVLIEVHWEFAEHFFSFAFDFDQMWQRLEPVVILGKPLLTLGPEDSLLVLCAHGSKHFWKRLGWINDVAQLISRHELDWKIVVKRAEALGLLRILRLGLLLASEVLGVEFPSEVDRRTGPEPTLEAIVNRIRSCMFSVENEPSGTIETTLLQWKMRERIRDRFNYCFRLVISTKLVDALFMPMGRPR